MYEDLKKRIMEYTNSDGKKLIYFGKNVVTTDTVTSKSEEFKSSELFNMIITATNFLPESTELRDRERCIFQNISEIPKCQICGNAIPFKSSNRFNAPCFGTAHVCDNKSCIAKYASQNRSPCSDLTKRLHLNSRLSNLQKFERLFANLINEATTELTEPSVDEKNKCQLFCKTRIETQTGNRPVFKMTDVIQHPLELKTLLMLTKFISMDECEKGPFKRLRLDERAYCLVNSLSKQPECELCGKKLPFVRASAGYSKNCGNVECLAEKNRLRHGMRKLTDYKADIDKSKFEIIHFPLNVTTEKLVVRCKRCGTISEWDVSDGRLKTLIQNRLCRACDRWTSFGEIQLADFIVNCLPKEEQSTVMRNCRSIISPLELDIYIPTRKIAFEFDGIFWHSESNGHNATYHLNKTKKCEELGIHLVHVFENEWEEKREIVCARISNILLNRSELHPINSYRSSKLVLDENISYTETAKFLEKFHIQGAGNLNIQTIRMGLRNKSRELISLMTFAKCKKGSKVEWELMRFCTNPNYIVFGGAGRLLKRFEKKFKPKSILSYADRRWTMNNGNAVYDKLKFKLDHVSKPNYWYWKLGKDKFPKLESRLKFQKHKLKSLLEHFDSTMSENQNMTANGYDRIFDCGNLVYVKEYLP